MIESANINSSKDTVCCGLEGNVIVVLSVLRLCPSDSRIGAGFTVILQSQLEMVFAARISFDSWLLLLLLHTTCSFLWSGSRHIIGFQNVRLRNLQGLTFASSEQKVKSKKHNRQSDDSGAAIGFRNVIIALGSNELVNDINWSILPKERWALVGRNGAGGQLS